MIISQTPLRISLLGGGTDLKEYYKIRDGFVVSTAIDKYVFIIVKERFDDLIYVNYSSKERTDSPLKIKHDLVKEALLKTGVNKGVEITMLADIPSEGSGLGSSSSLLVGLLNALYMYQGIQVTAERLAKEACDIEINKCKKPIGKQDQYIAAYGGLCSFKFKKTGQVEAKRLNLTESEGRVLGSNMLLFYTGITRQSSEILTEQRAKTKNMITELNLIKSLAEQAVVAINSKKYDKIGTLLRKNWKYKKKLSKNISNTFIDEMYSKALKAGALGGKISGAGGGGFLLLYCKREDQNNIRKAMKGYREMPFLLEKDGSKIIFNYRRYSWK
ncbi:MAG: GHMP kinase [Ignavibacteria bacterium]|nr:GHMP kinase [Ignavibacteria bacterium]